MPEKQALPNPTSDHNTEHDSSATGHPDQHDPHPLFSQLTDGTGGTDASMKEPANLPSEEKSSVQSEDDAGLKTPDIETSQTSPETTTAENIPEEKAHAEKAAVEKTAANGFQAMALHESVQRAVDMSGYTNPTPIQAQINPHADGRDVLARHKRNWQNSSVRFTHPYPDQGKTTQTADSGIGSTLNLRFRLRNHSRNMECFLITSG